MQHLQGQSAAAPRGPTAAAAAALAVAASGTTRRPRTPRGASHQPEYRKSSRLVQFTVADRYTSDDWLNVLKNLWCSRILFRIRWHVTCNLAWAVLVFVVNSRLHRVPALPATFLTCGVTALGLLLIFRTSSAYDRWWQGHTNTLAIIHDLHQIRRLSRLWMQGEDLGFVDECLKRFPGKLEHFLTGKGTNGEDPREILSDVGEHAHCRGRKLDVSLDVYTADRVQGHIVSALECVERMAQLSSVAVARNYSRHTSRFLSLWTLALPLILIEMGILMPAGVTMISWALLAIEEIGHCLEDPFNSPTEPVLVKDMIDESLDWEAYSA